MAGSSVTSGLAPMPIDPVAPPVFGIHPMARLHWARWDDECVVFDEASGQTYRMDTFRALVLDLLTEAPGSLAQITHRLGELLEHRPADAIDAIEDAVGDAVIESVGEFDRSGLVRSLQPVGADRSA